MRDAIRPAIILCLCLPVLGLSAQIWYIDARSWPDGSAAKPFDFWGLPHTFGMILVTVLPAIALVGLGWSIWRLVKFMRPAPLAPRAARPAGRRGPGPGARAG